MRSSNMYTQPSGVFKSAYIVRALRVGFASCYLCGRNFVICFRILGLTLDSWFNWFGHSTYL